MNNAEKESEEKVEVFAKKKKTLFVWIYMNSDKTLQCTVTQYEGKCREKKNICEKNKCSHEQWHNPKEKYFPQNKKMPPVQWTMTQSQLRGV